MRPCVEADDISLRFLAMTYWLQTRFERNLLGKVKGVHTPGV